MASQPVSAMPANAEAPSEEERLRAELYGFLAALLADGLHLLLVVAFKVDRWRGRA